ncbi:methyl-accepting chemotaxis protein [Phormidium sp. FACHB-322]|nr:methyl-accepting chemotaxis protein [Leptolyngbya sp. FACHB-60]MBD1916164.1 methyl-accepting chemotaxis protein [Phormidium sp. FACHB-77]MBD2031567.1 methyl-accepting chemotaxis protein [Phormidium sp. FACHB-322]MBD2052806.1 methyl-accepting chemotaxis protein [Leptolyngbya sp. FACHB-60]
MKNSLELNSKLNPFGLFSSSALQRDIVNKRKFWKLRHWIVLGYAVPVLALIVSAGIAVVNVRQLVIISGELKRAWEVHEKVDHLNLNVQIMSRATRGYLLQKHPTSLLDFNAAKTDYLTVVAELDAQVANEEQRQNLFRLTTLINQFITLHQGMIDLVNQNQTTAGVQFWRESDGRALTADIASLLTDMEDLEGGIVAREEAIQVAALRRLQFTLLTAATLSLLLSTLIGTLVIIKASRIMNQAAGNIVTSASEIATSVEQQERSSSQQAASVSETSTTMDELGASSRQSAEQAEAAAAGAQQVLALAEGGTRAVERSLDGMGDLREKVDAIADQILRLSAQTNQIGGISSLVSDLANQTNMLALNAAVEAVRAGEHGKGFAVVSGEIRKLADQSKKSAEKINALVADIQTAINSTVMVTDEGTKTVEEGVKIAEETADAFAGVAEAVNNVVLNSQQISLNVKQQAVAIQQVVSAMNSLNTGAQETAHGITQIKVGTHQLNESALQLKVAI